MTATKGDLSPGDTLPGSKRPIPQHRYRPISLLTNCQGSVYECADCGKTITLTVHPFGPPRS